CGSLNETSKWMVGAAIADVVTVVIRTSKLIRILLMMVQLGNCENTSIRQSNKEIGIFIENRYSRMAKVALACIVGMMTISLTLSCFGRRVTNHTVSATFSTRRVV